MSAESGNVVELERIAPTFAPDDIIVMWQRWSHLLFLHWEVDPEAIRRTLPKGLTLDLFEGRAYVGLVAFTMTGIRPRGLPAVRGLSDFHEVNVRTYVHCNGRGPGVWFYSLDAASRTAVHLARWTYRLPYRFAWMALNGSPTRGGEAVGDDVIRDYRSDRVWGGPIPAGCRILYRPTGVPAPARSGSLEHFLAERYLLYTGAAGRLDRAQVHHSPYPLQSAEVVEWQEDLIRAAGIARPEGPPFVHFAREVRVAVYPLRRVREGSGA